MSLEDTEINVGGVKFKGIYLAVVFGFVTTISGAIWTASELYSRLEAVEAYDIPDTTELHEQVELIKQELEDQNISELQGKLTELGVNLTTIIDQQKELLLIKERVVQAEKDVESMRTTVQEAKLVVKQVEDFDSFLKTFGLSSSLILGEPNIFLIVVPDISIPATFMLVCGAVSI